MIFQEYHPHGSKRWITVSEARVRANVTPSAIAYMKASPGSVCKENPDRWYAYIHSSQA